MSAPFAPRLNTATCYSQALRKLFMHGGESQQQRSNSSSRDAKKEECSIQVFEEAYLLSVASSNSMAPSITCLTPGDDDDEKSCSFPEPRCAHQAAILNNKGTTVLLFGGEYTNSSGTKFHQFNDSWIFDLVGQTFTLVDEGDTKSGGLSPKKKKKKGNSVKRKTATTKTSSSTVASEASRPVARSGHRMVTCSVGVLLFGGYVDDGVSEKVQYLDDTWIFVEKETRWQQVVKPNASNDSPLGPGPTSRSGVCICGHQNLVYLYGGFNETCFQDLYMMNVEASSPKWTEITYKGVPPTPAAGISCTLIPATNAILFFGGSYEKEKKKRKKSSAGELIYTNQTVVFQLDTMSFNVISSGGILPSSRSHSTLTTFDSQTALCVGGLSENHEVLLDIFLFSSRTNCWEKVFEAPSGKFYDVEEDKEEDPRGQKGLQDDDDDDGDDTEASEDDNLPFEDGFDGTELIVPKGIAKVPVGVIHTVTSWHFAMLNDLQRNQFYEQAIQTCVRKMVMNSRENEKTQQKVTFLDLGSGTGLLSLYALSCPETEWIVAVESKATLCKLSREIIQSNLPQIAAGIKQLKQNDKAACGTIDELRQKVKIINKKSVELTLSDFPHQQPPSIIVCELLGVLLNGERQLNYISAARKLFLAHQENNLQKNTNTTNRIRVIPRKGVQYAVLIESKLIESLTSCQTPEEQEPFMKSSTDHPSINMSRLNSIRNTCHVMSTKELGGFTLRKGENYIELSDPIPLFNIDYEVDEVKDISQQRGPFPVSCHTSGTVNAIMLYWEVFDDADDGECVGSVPMISTHPSRCSPPRHMAWGQGIQLFDNPSISVNRNAQEEGSQDKKSNFLSLKYRMSRDRSMIQLELKE